jgi:hypothetical protein
METGEIYKLPNKIKTYRLFQSKNITINASVAPILNQYTEQINEQCKRNTFFKPIDDGFYYDKFYINIGSSYFVFDEAINLIDCSNNDSSIILEKNHELNHKFINGLSSKYYITSITYYDEQCGLVKINLNKDLNPQIINGIECSVSNSCILNELAGVLVRRLNCRNYEIKNLKSVNPLTIKYKTSKNYHLKKDTWVHKPF